MFALRTTVGSKSLSALLKTLNTTSTPSMRVEIAVPKAQQYHHNTFPDPNIAKADTFSDSKPTMDQTSITEPIFANDSTGSKPSQFKDPKAQQSRFVTSANPLNTYTTTRFGSSSILNRIALNGSKSVCNFSMKSDAPPGAKKMELSPMIQAIHKLPNLKFQVSHPFFIVQHSQHSPLTKPLQPTFLYHKLAANDIPSGWSNDPAELKLALEFRIEECGLEFEVAILVALAQDGATVE